MKVRTMIAVAAAGVAVTATAAVPAFAAPHAASGGKFSFLISESSVGKQVSGAVVIHGAITAAGRDDQVAESYDVLHLNGGNLRVNHPDKDATFKYKPNAKTCYYSVQGTGTGTLSKGTGKFKGDTGTFTYKLTSSGLASKKNGKCNFNGVGIAYVGTVTGTGTLKA